LDGRSSAGKFVWGYSKELLVALGREPTVVEMRLIERAALLAAHLMVLDRRAFKEGGLTPRTTREYLAMHNSLTKTLAQLGPKAASPAPSESKPNGDGLRSYLCELDAQPDSDEPTEMFSVDEGGPP
jgi:hypothetical protein